MTEITVAVRDLVTFCHRTGDIDHRFSPSPTGVQGVEGHQRVYRRRPESYRSEYPVEFRYAIEAGSLLLRGRVDGYDAAEGVVEEIKTCRVHPSTIPESVTRMHLAQARIYAAIICVQEERPELEVRLNWFNIDSGEESILSQHYTRTELTDFLHESLATFAAWQATLTTLRAQRDSSLTQLAFPMGEFRPGQREIAELVYRCAAQGGQLLVEAPTGIGKTAAVLYPALKALATGKHDKLVFVTAKTIGRRAAEDTLALFSEAGMRACAMSLTAKDKVCFSPGKACHGDDCSFARGYYDRLPQAMVAASSRGSLYRADIEDIGRRYEVCPYQLSLDMLPWIDVLIADQHYVYGLTGVLAVAIQQDEQRWTALVDEAHNLPDRARDMYGATLAKSDLMAARQELTGAAVRPLEKVNRAMLALQREDWQEADHDVRNELPVSLADSLQGLVSAVGEQLAEDARFLQRQPRLMDFYFEVLQFLRVVECWGDEYRFEMSRGRGRQSLHLILNCLDPARLLGLRQQRLHSLTVFSATLSPGHWAAARLGLSDQAVRSRLDSPFDAGQLDVVLATHIDTRYRQRQASLPALAELLLHWLRTTPGNCIVYFPSYRYLGDCLACLDLADTGRTAWLQQAGMPESSRDELLQLLARQRNIAAFCILGGIFGEGIDLPGEQLASVVVVGVGLPQFNRDTRQQRDWYQQRYGSGFEYAYLYPGMQKVDQALGRVVRRSRDRGSALLVDTRYQQREYRSLLPAAWRYRPLEPLQSRAGDSVPE